MLSLPTLALLGAAHGLVLAIAILPMRKGDRLANQVLAAFLIVQAARLYALSFTYGGSHGGLWIYLLLHLSYTFGPLLYIYVRLLVDQHFRLTRLSLLHFIPVLVATYVLWPGGCCLYIDAGPGGFEGMPASTQRFLSLATVPVYISLMAYCLLAWRQLMRHRKRIIEQHSALELINLNWLRALIAFCFIAGALNAPIELLRAFEIWSFGPRVASSIILSVAMICYVGFMGMRQPAIFESHTRQVKGPATEGFTAPDAPTDAENEENSGAPEKYERSALSEDHIERLWQRLKLTMEETKPYLEPGIKLAELATLIGTRPNYLSQTINRQSGSSYFEFINQYRLQEACQLLEHNRDKTIGEIALAAGFNSQNIFNGHFKKKLGMTPTQFQRQLNSSAQE
jgi:AraC-like DNA-binding protein